MPSVVVLVAIVVLSPPAFAQFSSSNQTNTISGVTSNWVGDYVFNYPFDRLEVTSAGVLNNWFGYMGYVTGATNNSAVVSGNGPVWGNNGDLYVGYSGARSQLVITNGGVVYNDTGYVGYNNSSGNNSVLVMGTGSIWSNGFELYIGFSGAGNQLVISNGGAVYNSFSKLGSNPASSNNTVLVSGNGSVWANSGSLCVGNSGATNQLTIDGNGLVVANNAYIGFNSTSVSNKLIVSGGALYVTNGSSNAVLDVRRGTLTLNSGTVTVDRLLLNSGASSVIAFSGGALLTRSTTVSNGLPFTVGDGTTAATLTLRGGTHSFFNGLVITNNAVLAGTGTVSAVVIVAGTMAPGFSPGTITITGNLIVQTNAVLNFELGTNSDLVAVSSNLTLAGTLNVINSGGFGVGDYILITYGGSLTDNGLTNNSLPGGFSGSISNDLVLKRVVLHVTSGPPPADPFGTWQSGYFGCTNCPQAAAHADPLGKGISNANQYLLGLNPTNAASVFRIISTVKQGGTATITWRTSGGDPNGMAAVTNVVQGAVGTAGGGYSNNFTDISGPLAIVPSGDTSTNYVDSAGTNQYYRIRLGP